MTNPQDHEKLHNTEAYANKTQQFKITENTDDDKLINYQSKVMYLKVTYPFSWDLSKAITDYATGHPIDLTGCEITLSNSRLNSEKIIQKGMTEIITGSTLLLEHVIKPKTPLPIIKNTLQKFLDNIGVSKELIIVDPYFYAKIKDKQQLTDYCDLIGSCLEKYSTVIENIYVVTDNGKNDPTTKNALHQKIRTTIPGVILNDTYSPDFHDRFWITNNRLSGILIGTSMNHIGKKYALIDYLKKDDVELIIQEFTSLGLIPAQKLSINFYKRLLQKIRSFF